MRGLPGLIIAAGLGIVGAICNWFYLSRQAAQMEKVSFVAVESTAQLNLGDRFKESDLVQVDIPKDHLGNLNEVAVPWKNVKTVVGRAATRAYRGGELVLQSDLRTPSERDFSHLLAKDELGIWVPVDSSSFVPEGISPGDWISFLTSGTGTGTDGSTGDSANPGISSSGNDIGPFQILSLGARTGARDVRLANSRSSGEESVVGIRVKVIDGKMEPKAERLLQFLRTNGSPLQVVLYSHEMEEKPLP